MEYIIPAVFSNVYDQLIEQETYPARVIYETASRITNEVIRLFFIY